jgi:hypothetical protein
MPQEIKEQEITDEEQQLAANPPIEDDLGEDEDALSAHQLPQERTDPNPLDDKGGFRREFETVLDDDLKSLDLNEPRSDTGEEV